jgi:hypothetical protein
MVKNSIKKKSKPKNYRLIFNIVLYAFIKSKYIVFNQYKLSSVFLEYSIQFNSFYFLHIVTKLAIVV